MHIIDSKNKYVSRLMCIHICLDIQGGPKKPHTILLSISLLNI